MGNQHEGSTMKGPSTSRTFSTPSTSSGGVRNASIGKRRCVPNRKSIGFVKRFAKKCGHIVVQGSWSTVKAIASLVWPKPTWPTMTLYTDTDEILRTFQGCGWTACLLDQKDRILKICPYGGKEEEERIFNINGHLGRLFLEPTWPTLTLYMNTDEIIRRFQACGWTACFLDQKDRILHICPYGGKEEEVRIFKLNLHLGLLFLDTAFHWKEEIRISRECRDIVGQSYTEVSLGDQLTALEMHRGFMSLSHYMDKYPNQLLVHFEKIWKEILRQIDELHARGVVHLDMKPSNVLLKFQNGNVIVALCDFGGALNTRGRAETFNFPVSLTPSSQTSASYARVNVTTFGFVTPDLLRLAKLMPSDCLAMGHFQDVWGAMMSILTAVLPIWDLYDAGADCPINRDGELTRFPDGRNDMDNASEQRLYGAYLRFFPGLCKKGDDSAGQRIQAANPEDCPSGFRCQTIARIREWAEQIPLNLHEQVLLRFSPDMPQACKDMVMCAVDQMTTYCNTGDMCTAAQLLEYMKDPKNAPKAKTMGMAVDNDDDE